MYAEHASEISADCKASPAAFLDVLTFVLLTIQEPLERVSGQLADVRRDGERAPGLWGMKRRGYQDAKREHVALWRRISARMASRNPLNREACLVDIVDTIHGLGTVKAGFVLQLGWNVVGCLDSHNLKRYGLNRADFNIAPGTKRASTKTRKAVAYVAACDALGGCGALWDSWCQFVAELRPGNWENAEAVSAAHLVAVVPF